MRPRISLLFSVFNHLDVREEINDFTKPSFVQFRAGKVLGQDVLETLILFFNAAHSVIYDRADLWCVCSSGYDAPSCVLWNKEDILRRVFILVFFKTVALSNQLLIFCFKAIRYVF